MGKLIPSAITVLFLGVYFSNIMPCTHLGHGHSSRHLLGKDEDARKQFHPDRDCWSTCMCCSSNSIEAYSLFCSRSHCRKCKDCICQKCVNIVPPNFVRK